MAVGFETRNTSGVIQVDSANRNYLLIKSGQFTINGDNPADMATRWTAENPIGQTSASLMVVRSTPNFWMRPTTGGYLGSRKVCNFAYDKFFGKHGTFQYYMYDLVTPRLSDRLGLQVFDDKGNLTYNALDYPLRILYASHNWSAPTAYVSPHDNFAYGSLSGGKDVNSDDIDTECYYTYMTNSGRSVLIDYRYDQFGDPEGGPVGNYGDSVSTLLVADVSNIPLNWSRQ